MNERELLIRKCVAQGAQRLDTKFGKGNWEDEIDLDILDQGSADICVLGQLSKSRDYSGGYMELLQHLGLAPRNCSAGENGFDSIGPLADVTHEEMTEAWSSFIGNRLNGNPDRLVPEGADAAIQWAEDVLSNACRGEEVATKALAIASAILVAAKKFEE